MIEVIKNYVNGELIGPTSKKYIDVFEPATGKIYSHVPNSNDNDTDLAVSAARRAFPIWSKHSLKTRSNYLLKLASEIKKDSEELAFYESRDTGKPISLARRLDIPRAIENFTFFSDYTQNFTDHFTFESEDSKNYIQKSPLDSEGIYYKHDESNMLLGYAYICGPKDSMYFGGNYFYKFELSVGRKVHSQVSLLWLY